MTNSVWPFTIYYDDHVVAYRDTAQGAASYLWPRNEAAYARAVYELQETGETRNGPLRAERSARE